MCFLSWVFDISPLYALVVTLSVVGHYIEREISKLTATVARSGGSKASMEEMLSRLKPISLTDFEKEKLRAGIRKAHNKREGGEKCED
jgi:hypothetical protein